MDEPDHTEPELVNPFSFDEIKISLLEQADAEMLYRLYITDRSYKSLLEKTYVLKKISKTKRIPYVVEHVAKGERIVDVRIKNFGDLFQSLLLRENLNSPKLDRYQQLEHAIRDDDIDLLRELIKKHFPVDRTIRVDISRVNDCSILIGEYGNRPMIDTYFQYAPTRLSGREDITTTVFVGLAKYHRNELSIEMMKIYQGVYVEYFTEGTIEGLNFKLLDYIIENYKSFTWFNEFYQDRVGGLISYAVATRNPETLAIAKEYWNLSGRSDDEFKMYKMNGHIMLNDLSSAKAEYDSINLDNIFLDNFKFWTYRSAIFSGKQDIIEFVFGIFSDSGRLLRILVDMLVFKHPPRSSWDAVLNVLSKNAGDPSNNRLSILHYIFSIPSLSGLWKIAKYYTPDEIYITNKSFGEFTDEDIEYALTAEVF